MSTCLKIRAAMENLDMILKKLEEILSAHSCSPKAAYQICVSVEEIFTNIASYAYHEETGDAVISFTFPESGEDRILRIMIQDWGIPYNPLEREEPDLTLPIEERPVGGLGIYMVKKFMDRVEYRYEHDSNILTMEKHL